jgi:hypothetical protein
LETNSFPLVLYFSILLFYIHMYINGKMRSVETIPEIDGRGDKEER